MDEQRPNDLVSVLRTVNPPSQPEYNDSWSCFSAEIRLMILELIVQEEYASVSREWQGFFEEKNFSSIKLRVSCLDEFPTMTRRTKHLVKHIWLHIELPSVHKCYDCGSLPKINFEENRKFKMAILPRLFSVLSCWPPVGSLALELSITSEDDAGHWFKTLNFESISEMSREDSSAKEPPSVEDHLHDPNHGWFEGQQALRPPAQALEDLFSKDYFIVPCPPKIPAITGFVLRRQARRQIASLEIAYLFTRLPRLETVVYEPWEPPPLHAHNDISGGMFNTIQKLAARDS